MKFDAVLPLRLPHIVRASVVLMLALLVLAISNVSARAQQIAVVRDAEIETLVRDYVRPILEAAGLSRSGIEIVLVSNDAFNAFVAGRRIFINTGALMTAETPNEIIGVLAHEAGHLAGGHQERLREQLSRAQTLAVASMIAGIGAGIAGGSSGNRGLAQGGLGVAMGGMEAARRGLLSYQRTEETAADRAAITYLERTGQSGRGMLRTFERFAGSHSLSGVRIDPYQISHPMPRERIANLETLVRQSPHYERRDPPQLQLRHDLARAKIVAYTQGPQALAQLFRNDPQGLPARYGDAINTFLRGSPSAAIEKMNALIREHPNNAYFHEMLGEVLLRANRPGEAANAVSRAMQLDTSNSGILQVARGRALMETGDPSNLDRAIQDLRGGLERAREYSAGYRHLARALGQKGDIGGAELATAEGHFYSGSYQDARIFAARAQQRLPNGSPGWVRAQDIINYRAN